MDADGSILYATITPLQIGANADHCPLAWHTRLVGPIRLNPLLQL